MGLKWPRKSGLFSSGDHIYKHIYMTAQRKNGQIPKKKRRIGKPGTLL